MPYWKAFSDLTTSRQTSQAGPSPILVGEVLAWLLLHDIEGTESRVEFLYFVRQLDIEFLDYVSTEMKRKTDTAQSKAKTDQIVRRR